MTKLRDDNGVIWYVPNGSITARRQQVAGLGRRGRAGPGAADAPTSTASRRCCARPRPSSPADPHWHTDILDEPAVVSVESITPEAVQVRVRLHTKATRQGPVTRELRVRVKQALDAAGVSYARPALAAREQMAEQAGAAGHSRRRRQRRGACWSPGRSGRGRPAWPPRSAPFSSTAACATRSSTSTGSAGSAPASPRPVARAAARQPARGRRPVPAEGIERFVLAHAVQSAGEVAPLRDAVQPAHAHRRPARGVAGRGRRAGTPARARATASSPRTT